MYMGGVLYFCWGCAHTQIEQIISKYYPMRLEFFEVISSINGY